MTVAASANAFPRVNIATEPEPIAPWSDPSNPLAFYGLQTFSKSVYRPVFDEVLTEPERNTFERLYSAGTEQLAAKDDKIAQSTLLAYGILDVATDFGDDEPAKALKKIRQHISDFKSDPGGTTENIAQHLVDTDQVVLWEQEAEIHVSPPETRLGAKVVLENVQIRLKQQDITLVALDEVFNRLSNERISPTSSQLIVEMGYLLQVLDQCPEPDVALSTLYYAAGQELGSNEITLRK
jgi:hypothetical protein